VRGEHEAGVRVRGGRSWRGGFFKPTSDLGDTFAMKKQKGFEAGVRSTFNTGTSFRGILMK